MFYVSTRGNQPAVSSAEAIKMGISPDGGLFVPDAPVTVGPDVMRKMKDMTYRDRAAEILRLYLTDFTAAELEECTGGAYNTTNYDVEEIAPVKELESGTYVLELWHGPTCAFKDMALQILPRFLPRAAAKTGEKGEIVILVATSGDTGKAALEGFKDVPGTRIFVFFPDQGVSQVQRLQMITQEGGNVGVASVRGNFDDAQSGVKAIFTDPEMNRMVGEKGFRFSSANSINWGRLAPQIVYYFSAYLDLLKEGKLSGGEPVNFVVPTGNFGNILAGFYASEAGLPVNRLICAANENNVLTDFIRTGVYDRNRRFVKTISPSMDILISSNLERLLYELTGRDTASVRGWMQDLKENGVYRVGREIYSRLQSLFWSDFSDDRETMAAIRDTYESTGYVADTHTAVGLDVYKKYVEQTGDRTKTVIVSTASPFKFNASVVKALLGEEAVAGKNEFELLKVLAQVSLMEIPAGLRGLERRPVLHQRVVAGEEMPRAVLDFLGI
ncbi:threonine synthase [Desulfocucumis palustris]|uniref:Threonine synthase n=1 Tax=Desulfocucumis palustris TaxID=1898651 RepID=A0A2L2XK03_9FIRM|nr:threonine synthase [Desulfocucumis palustris]GBF34606.1 threonine synthase [Desulfocucumis palustris]